MRIKKDTILKANILSETAYLTNEEFGALIRNIMIADDKDGFRYEDLTGIYLKTYEKREQDWQEDLERLTLQNPTLIAAHTTVYKQVAHSRRAFESLQGNSDGSPKQGNKGDPKGTGATTPALSLSKNKDEFEIEFEDGESVIFEIEFEGSNVVNTPTKNEMIKYRDSLKGFSIEDKKTILEAILSEGSKNKWKKHWKEYAKTAEAYMK